VQAVEYFGLDGPVDRWRALRAQIHREACEQGYDAERGTFTQYYGGTELDAALLLLPRLGFLPYSDERVVGTVEVVQRELVVDGFVLRYRNDAGVDGRPGGEGAFLACSFWLVDALHAPSRRGSCSSGCSRCATTSGCWPRSGTPAPVARSATSRRRSATSRWSPARRC